MLKCTKHRWVWMFPTIAEISPEMKAAYFVECAIRPYLQRQVVCRECGAIAWKRKSYNRTYTIAKNQMEEALMGAVLAERFGFDFSKIIVKR